MKFKKIVCILCSAAVLFSTELTPLGSLTVSAKQTLVDVPEYEVTSHYDPILDEPYDVTETRGSYLELQPDKNLTPDMPDVLKNRKPKHHVFERLKDHSVNLRNELIMPGDTFEIPNEITYDYIYTSQFKGRYKEIEWFSPENYGIEVKGSVDVIDYTEFETTDKDGHIIKDKFFKTAKNNLNCPITLCSNSGGDGPYVFYEDHDQRKGGPDITYCVYAPYYYLSYRFSYDKNSVNYAEFKKLFWPAGEFDSLEFPECYWLSDIPYTLKIPNVRMEGCEFGGWNAGNVEDGINYQPGDFSKEGQKIVGDYTELTVQWVYEFPNIDDMPVSELQHYYSDVNFYNAGTLYMYPMLGGNKRTILFDANGGTINGRDKWLIEVNEVKREDTPMYGENSESRIPDDGDFGFEIADYVPEKDGDTFLGWCAEPSALYTSFVTKNSTIEAYRYLWENDEYGTFTDKYTRQQLYAKWASETEEAFEKNGWKLNDDGKLYILNNDGAAAWCEARKKDPTLAPKVKSIQLGLKDEKVTYLPERCFEGCTSLKELTFDENVRIGACAFAGCTNLTDITINSKPSGLGNDCFVFFEANKDIIVHVPENLFDEYKQTYGDYAYLLEKPKGQRYALSVNGQIITDENLTVKCGDGIAVFDPKSNTLKLKNAVLKESLTPHCCSLADDSSENGVSYPNAAVVSGLDNLTIVIEGTVDVNTTVSNVYGASKEELPKFVRAYGNLQLKGSGTLKSTKEDMSFYYKDPETMDYKMYVGSGKVGIKTLENLTINDINCERLYADVSGDFSVNNANLYGGQIIADGNISAKNTTVKPFNAPEGDMQLSTELPAVSSKGSLSSYTNCNFDGILLSAGEQSKSLTFKDCVINASYQIRGGNDTNLGIINTSIEMYDDKIAVTNIPDKNITLNDCKITQGAWNEKGIFILTATGEKENIGLIIGDLDGDEKITSADSLIILRMSVSLEPTTKENKPLADVDDDGKVTSADALEVLRASVGLPAKEKIGNKL